MNRKLFLLSAVLLVLVFASACGSFAEPPYAENHDASDVSHEAVTEDTTHDEAEPTEEVHDTATDATEEVVAATEEPTVEPTEEVVEATEEPTVEPTEEVVEATEEPTVEPTEEVVEATEEPTVEPTEEVVEATEEPAEPVNDNGFVVVQPEDDIALTFVEAADAGRGEQLFTTFTTTGFACNTCHYIDQDTMLIGPGLFNVIDRAGTRVSGQGPYTYLYTSIRDSQAFIVDGYPAGVMPQYGTDIFSEQDIYDLVAYLTTLK